MPRNVTFSFVILLSLFATMIAAASAELQLKLNEGKLYEMGTAVRDILITNPDIADIQLTQSNGLFVYGKKLGRTHILVLADGDRVLFDRLVTVGRDLKNLHLLLDEQFPDSQVEMQLSPGRLMLSGEVSSTSVLTNILSLAGGYLVEGEELVNHLRMASPLQVNLRVRIIEMNRLATKNIGINWNVLLNPGSMAINLISGRNPLTLGGASGKFRGWGSWIFLARFFGRRNIKVRKPNWS